jgi:hypothetical protein
VSLSARQRWVVLVGLLTATLTAAAWLSEEGDRSDPATPAASHSRGEAGRTATPRQASQVNLEKLKPRKLEAPSRDPFAIPSVRREAPKSIAAPPAPASPPVAVAVPEPPPPPSAPPLPFTYMGKLFSASENKVFLVSGERNLVVREGDTIDATYRVEKVTSYEITLVYLPLNQRQTLEIGDTK